MLQETLQTLSEEGACVRLIETPYGDPACPSAGTWLLAADKTGILRLTSLLALSAEPEEAAEALSALPRAPRGAKSVCDIAEELLHAWWSEEIESLNGSMLRFSKQLPGTPFEKRVWSAARWIPPGAKVSYRKLAAALGEPSASQAVGNALRRNPVILITPCHRVLPAAAIRAGTIDQVGGFSGSLTGPLTDLKRRILAWEAERFEPEPGWESFLKIFAKRSS